MALRTPCLAALIALTACATGAKETTRSIPSTSDTTVSDSTAVGSTSAASDSTPTAYTFAAEVLATRRTAALSSLSTDELTELCEARELFSNSGELLRIECVADYLEDAQLMGTPLTEGACTTDLEACEGVTQSSSELRTYCSNEAARIGTTNCTIDVQTLLTCFEDRAQAIVTRGQALRSCTAAQSSSPTQASDGYDYNELLLDTNFNSVACQRLEASNNCGAFDRTL